MGNDDCPVSLRFNSRGRSFSLRERGVPMLVIASTPVDTLRIVGVDTIADHLRVTPLYVTTFDPPPASLMASWVTKLL